MLKRSQNLEDLLSIVDKVIDSSLHDGATLSLRDLDLLLSIRITKHYTLDFEAQRLLFTGRLMAHSRNGNVEEAHRLALEAEQSWPDPRDFELDATTLISFQAAIIEAFLGAGDPIHAIPWVSRMAQLASELDDPRWAYRTEGVLAVTFALNGEWDRAEKHVANGERIANAAGWPATDIDFMHASALALDAFLTLDAIKFQNLAIRLRHLAVREPTSGDLAELCDAMAMLLTGHESDASEQANRIQQGIYTAAGPLLIRTFAVYLEAFLQLREGRPILSINAIAEQKPLEKHLLCPGVMRGAAMIQMGDYSRALTATSPCIKARQNHAQWSYPLILAVRAIALFRTGHSALALMETMKLRKWAPAAIERLIILPWLLPQTDLLDLLAFCQDKIFWEEPLIAQVRAAILHTARDHDGLTRVQQLSERESIVARHLRGDASLGEIAEVLFVSRGTITAQSSSIYRKLGVRNRLEAVQYLEGIGFYESDE